MPVKTIQYPYEPFTKILLFDVQLTRRHIVYENNVKFCKILVYERSTAGQGRVL